MPKILKPYTIIPPELYVQRDADRQLKFIINDMGRPGYVLVSRQMGKTNLLLNAKRKLETPDDVFVYVDLSNPFDCAKTCFENIINTALESNYEKFNAVSNLITQRRKELNETPPHKQHVNELRSLLNSIKGKLVIILDEIDVLTKTQYSDQIFAQIRSIYFSRVNYNELERLTYILSGVVEPTEIIKDPKISPFNIGQKIFLNDFSRQEFDQFLENSQMTLSSEIKERIFYWTNGNPRITWDVCSEVENLIINSKEVSLSSIDKIIEDHYLTSYDKPPIDNIRELVKKDPEIRNAIVEIGYNKGKEVSDKIRSKLYLTGIINYNDSDIHIKNRVIEKSLSLDWIKELEEEDKGLVKIALELYEKENYVDSLRTFEKYLIDYEFEEAAKSLYYFYMGSAAYKIFEFQKALNYLNKSTFDPEEDSKWYYKTLNLKGLVYHYLEKYQDSLSCLLEIVKSGRKDEIYVRALLNYGSISILADKKEYKIEAVNIFSDIIEEKGYKREKLKEELISELKTIAHYNLAQIFNKDKDYEKALSNYRNAIEFSKENTKPTIVLKLLKLSKDEKEKNILINDLLNLIESGKIEPSDIDPDKPLEYSFDDFKNLAIYTYIFDPKSFDKFKTHLSILGKKEISQHLYELAIYSINENKDWESATKILNSIYFASNDPGFIIESGTKYQVLKLLAFSTSVKESTNKHIEYINFFERNRIAPIDYIDFDIFASLIFMLIEKHNFKKALKYVDIINSVKTLVPEELQINYLVIGHLELNTYMYLNDRSNAKRKAEEVLRMTKDESIKQQKSNLLGDTGLDIIKQNAEAILRPPVKTQTPIIKGKSYGRNDIVKVRYRDGSVVVTKYKKIELDLKNGKCFILN